MSDPTARYTFLPYLRSGLAASILTPDDPADTTPGRVSVAVEVKVNETSHEGLVKQVKLVGPGDITGIQAQAIVRTSPPAGAQSFEPNYFPFIEFFEEDFLWRYTPAAPVGNRLRPWLFLLVLKREEFKPLISTTKPLPAIEITPEGLPFAFPQLDEHWAWAHAQANPDLAPQAGTLDEKLAVDPRSAICRLLGSRALEANTHYSAFLAPAFEAGRLAGLGQDNSSTPAQQSSFGANQFPFYHSFDFATGAAGDFESLVRALTPQAIDPAVGKQPLDISDPGLGISVPENGRMTSLDGALLPPLDAPTAPLSLFDGPALAGEMIPVLNAPAKLQEEGHLGQPGPNPAGGIFAGDIFGLGHPAQSAADPVVAPPLYGQWHTDRNRLDPVLPADLGTLDWFHQLNLEPGLRAAAGLGAEVVRRNQQSYLQQCWDQVGELLEANRKIRQIQLAKEASEAALKKHLRDQSAEALLAMSHRIHDRIPSGNHTLRQKTRDSALSNAAVTANVRRILRPGGPLLKRIAKASTTTAKVSQHGLVQRMTATSNPLRAAQPWSVSSEQSRIATAELHRLTQAVAQVNYDPQTSVDYHVSAAIRLALSGPILEIMRSGLATFDGFFAENQWPGTPVYPAFDANQAQADILAALSPLRRFQGRIGALLSVGPAIDTSPDLELPSLWTCPKLDAPTYLPLVDIAHDYLLPNLDKIPDNSVSIMQVNQAFLEAYMAGMNHEMLRELMWREFPTTQQGTIFRYFWDHADNLLPGQSEAQRLDASRDILDLQDWPADSQIGTHGVGDDPGLVLVIRGELLRKYPNTVVYAAQVNLETYQISEERFPTFSAQVGSDIVLLGFDVPESEAIAPDSAWYFILQERPGEPRFKLDVAAAEAGPAPTTFNDVSWGDVGLTDGHLDLDHADGRANIAGQAATWGSTAADMAHIFYQDPIRIALHAPDLVAAPLVPVNSES